MSRRLSTGRRLRTAARWPPGLLFTGLRYLLRTTPMHRAEHQGDAADHGPPPLPPDVDRHEIQGLRDGAGPLFHRRYRTRIRRSTMTPSALMADIAEDFDRVAPREFSSFVKVAGRDGEMAVGDEYVVRMPGPWDGPVRVVARGPQSFRLATLSSHLEAGQIEFRACERDDLLVFEIESWARSGDQLANLLYARLRMAKETQVHMWVSVLERVVRRTGGRMTGGIDLDTTTCPL